MAVTEELTVLITAQNAQLLTALDDVNKKLGGMGEAAKAAAAKTGFSLDEAAKSAMKWSAAAAAAAGGAIYLFKQISDGAEATGNLANSLGISYAAMAKMQYAASQMGVEQGALTQGLRIMQRTLGDVASGANEQAGVALKKLGLNLADLQAMDADQQFAAIGTALAGVQDETVRASMAADLLGRSFGQVMPMVQGDTAQLYADFERMGGALDQVSVEALDRAGDAIGRVEMAAKLAAQTFAAEMAPAVEAAANMTFELMMGTSDYGKETMRVSDVVKIGMGTVLNVLNVLKGTLQIATAAVMQLGAAGVETFEWMLAGINMVWKPFQTMINGWIQIHNLVFDDAQWPLLGDLDKAVSATENIGDNLHNAAVGLASKGMESIAAGFRGDASKDFNKRTGAAQSAAVEAADGSMGKRDLSTELEEIKSDEEIKGAAKDEAKAIADAKAHENEMKRAEEWAEQQRVAALDEEEAMMAEYRAKEQTLQDHLANKLISEESYASASAALASKLNGDITALNDKQREKEDADAKAKLARQKQDFTSTISSAAQHNKTFFEMNKAMKLAEAALNLKSSISGAYAVGSQIGGPVVGAAFAVAAGAAQLVNMQAIASASFGGAASSAGGASGGGGAASPAASVAAPAAAQSAPQRQQRVSTFNLQGDFFSRDSVRSLIQAIGSEEGDGSVYRVL